MDERVVCLYTILTKEPVLNFTFRHFVTKSLLQKLEQSQRPHSLIGRNSIIETRRKFPKSYYVKTCSVFIWCELSPLKI